MMELFTRLINEGIFVFWKDEKDENQHELKVSLFNGENKVNLIKKIVKEGQNFYSLTNIGAGDYEIELTSIKENKPVQTVVKKIKLTSSTQREVELMDKIDLCSERIKSMVSGMSGIENLLNFNISTSIDRIYDTIQDPRNITVDNYISFIKWIKRELR